MFSSKYFTWCEKSVVVFLVGMAIVAGQSLFTHAYWRTYGPEVLKDAASIWLFLRFVDMIFCLPERRALKRHLDELEKQKFGKYWKPR